MNKQVLCIYLSKIIRLYFYIIVLFSIVFSPDIPNTFKKIKLFLSKLTLPFVSTSPRFKFEKYQPCLPFWAEVGGVSQIEGDSREEPTNNYVQTML